MKRLLGIIKMNPEVDPSEWDHTDVSSSVLKCIEKWELQLIFANPNIKLTFLSVKEQLYGIGTERTVEKFYETFGIDVVHKKVEQHLCKFVRTGKMHNMFLPFLRSNGMGIDYSKIDYKFVDPDK